RERAASADAQIIAAVVLQQHRARQAGDGPTDRVAVRGRDGRGAGGPVVGGGGVVGHQAGGAARQGAVGDGDPGGAVLLEGDGGADGAEGELGTGRQGAAVIAAAELGERAGSALVEAQLRGAV